MTVQSTRVIGSLSDLGDGKGAVRMEDLYDTDVRDLWSALTEPDRLARWMGTVDGDLRVGGDFTATFTSTWEGPGRVDVCDAPHHLVVTLEPGTDDETVIEASLTAEGEQTRLVIEERGLPVPRLYAHGAGWQAHVEDLATYLRGEQPAPWRERWEMLRPTYEELAAELP